MCRFCVLNSICGFSIILSIVLLPLQQGCEYQQRLNGRATKNRAPYEVTFSMHRFSKMRVVSKFFAVRAVAFKFFRITRLSVFGCVFSFSVGAISASTSLASRSVSTDDAVPTSPLRPCGVGLVSRSLLAKTCFSKLATAHWTATTQGRPRRTYACGAEARIQGRTPASTNCFRATTYVHKVDLLRNLRMFKSQLVHVHSCVRLELNQVHAIVQMIDDDDNAPQTSAFHTMVTNTFEDHLCVNRMCPC